MPRSPYLIVKEFCDSGSDQQRKSAATALAAIADQESLDELVRMGLHKTAAEVRERIKLEVVGLPPEKRAKVGETLADNVRQAGIESRPAYRFLGELRSNGMEVRRPPISILRRLQLARSLHEVVYPNKAMADRMRGGARSLAGIVVACIAAILIQIQTLAPRPASEGESPVVLFSSLLAIFIAVISLKFSSPIALHPDRPAIAFLDMLAAALVSAPISAIMALIMLSSSGGKRAAVAVALMLPVLAVATRLGMLPFLGLFKAGSGNFWAGIFGGAAAGILAMSLVPLFFGVAETSDVSTFWFLLLPVSAGLAVPWAQQDASVPVNCRIPYLIRIIGVLPVLIFVAAVTVVLLPKHVAAPKAENFPVIVEIGKPTQFTIHSLPATISIQSALKVQATVTAIGTSSTNDTWTAGIYDSSNRYKQDSKSVSSRTDAVLISDALEPGPSSIKISCGQCIAPPLLALVFRRLGSLFRTPTDSPSLGNITVAFGPPVVARPLYSPPPPSRSGKAK